MPKAEFHSFLLLREHAMEAHQPQKGWLAGHAEHTLNKGFLPHVSLWENAKIINLGETLRIGGLIQASYPKGIDADPANISVVGVGAEAITEFIKKYGTLGNQLQQMGKIFLGKIGDNPPRVVIGIQPDWHASTENEYLTFPETYPAYFDRLRSIITVGIAEAATSAFQAEQMKALYPLPTGDDLIIAAHAMKNNEITTRRTKRENSIWLTSVPNRKVDIIPFPPPAVQEIIHLLTRPDISENESLSLTQRYDRFKRLQEQLYYERTHRFFTPFPAIGLLDPDTPLQTVLSHVPQNPKTIVISNTDLVTRALAHYQKNPLFGVNIAAVARSLGIEKSTASLRYRQLHHVRELADMLPPLITDDRYRIARAIEVFAYFDIYSTAETAQVLQISHKEVETLVSFLASKQLIIRHSEIIQLRNERVRLLRREQRLGNTEIAQKLGLSRSQVYDALREEQITDQESAVRLRKNELHPLKLPA